MHSRTTRRRFRLQKQTFSIWRPCWRPYWISRFAIIYANLCRQFQKLQRMGNIMVYDTSCCTGGGGGGGRVHNFSVLKITLPYKTLKLHRKNERVRTTFTKVRRSRADMIEVFKILNGIDKCEKDKLFTLQPMIRTRGHSQKFFKRQFRLDLRKQFFSQRVKNETVFRRK